jgi:hypothetical protein
MNFDKRCESDRPGYVFISLLVDPLQIINARLEVVSEPPNGIMSPACGRPVWAYPAICKDPVIADLKKQSMSNFDLTLACEIERTWWISKIGREKLEGAATNTIMREWVVTYERCALTILEFMLNMDHTQSSTRRRITMAGKKKRWWLNACC